MIAGSARALISMRQHSRPERTLQVHQRLRQRSETKEMAEREGFEPPIPFRVCRFSRPEPSTTRPPLRLLCGCQTAIGRSVSLQQERRISVLRQKTERFGMKFHDFGEVRQKIAQAV